MMIDDQIQMNNTKYKICGQIGQGGVGHVYIVKNQYQQKKYALKIIKDYTKNPIIKEMVDQEITIQKSFNNSHHIIKILGSKILNGRMYILLQLGSCSLRNRMVMQSHIELKEFIDIALDITKGLTAIHQKNLIHRDIKPQNIICIERSYKITDFGSLQKGQTGQARIGTPLYLPPEMLFDQDSKYDQKIDVWSLGVTLFQAYFRIHPFYYSKITNSIKQAYAQLKNNIKCLTSGPNGFNFDNLLLHLQDQGKFDQCKSIQNKILVTPKQILQQFQQFFKQPKKRPDIEYFAAVYESLQQTVRDKQVKKSHLLIKAEQIPSDIKFYSQTLNLFYNLCSRYGNKNYQQIQFHIQLAMWYWNSYNYLQTKYLQYNHIQRLKAYKKQRHQLWSQVQQVLLDYWLELSSNTQLTFFQHLEKLKIRILICGARYKIYKNLQKFLKSVSNKVQMLVEDLQMLQKFLQIFEASQIKAIQEILLQSYYYS